jgi:hypothetical protein
MQLSPSMVAKLDALADRFEEVGALLAEPEWSATATGSPRCRASSPSSSR